MYCPNCSTEASTEQKFCRSCGMELRAVAELIHDQSPEVKQLSCKDPAFQPRHRVMPIWGFIIMFAGVGVGVSLKVLGKEGIRPFGEFTPYLSVLMLLSALLGMGLMCFPFLQMSFGSARSRRQKSELTNGLRPAFLPEERTSITEQTTGLLETVDVRIAVRDTAPHTE